MHFYSGSVMYFCSGVDIPAFVIRSGWGSAEVEHVTARAHQLCEDLGDSAESFRILFGICALHLMRGELRSCLTLGPELFEVAKRNVDLNQQIRADDAFGAALCQTGRFSEAKERLQRACSARENESPNRLLSRSAPLDAGLSASSHLGLRLWFLGYPDQAVQQTNQATTLAKGLSHPFSLAHAEFLHCLVLQCRRDYSEVRPRAEQNLSLVAFHELGAAAAYAKAIHGWALVCTQENGITEIREGLEGLQSRGEYFGTPFLLTILADACLQLVLVDEGLEAVSSGLETVESMGARVTEAELYRLQGQLLLLKDSSKSEEARACFERAIEIAREQEAKSWELRATISLARLLANHNHRNEARTRLAEIYDWFTEGFNTLDLKEAKALIDELSD
jgi:tetratricopeptide (TPR) repeat protein